MPSRRAEVSSGSGGELLKQRCSPPAADSFADEPARWAQAIRGDLELLRQRALETYAGAALHIGRTELATAERASRELVALAPFRETGHRLLMQALAAQGNAAEALRAYDFLRVQLRDELGVDPSAQTRALHAELLSL